ncbi:MAG TPA: hypothetical protein DEP87_00120 [Candidatus Pacebacteria bacterium]|nr:hypothetical protein [Candidatus Paceibacterota bacterium]
MNNFLIRLPQIRKFWLWTSLFLVIMGLAIWLRFSQLTQIPPAPYWEEVALGYDAYSLAQTGKDHHGHAWPVAAFESFGDWKPSGYFYAAMVSLKLFGFSLWSIRFPATVAGVIFVSLMGLSGWLAWRFWQIGSRQLWLFLLALAAICPWAIIFSRAAWEVMLATSLFLAALICFWWSIMSWSKKSNQVFFASGLSLIFAILSMYTYHALRLITPLMFGWTLSWWFWQSDKKAFWQTWQRQKIPTIIFGTLALVITIGLLSPILQNLTSPIIRQRFAETSILNSIEPILASNTAKAEAGNTLLARLIYHRYWYQLQLIVTQYLKHLNLDFLFIHGDVNPRHSVQFFGQLYYLDAIFIVLGAGVLWKKHRNWAIYLGGWWLIATLPAALTTAAPHALRSLAALPVWLWLTACGVNWLTQKWRWALGLIVSAYALSLMWFWSAYTLIYPQNFGTEWQMGYCEMYQALAQAMTYSPKLPVYVTRAQGRPAMYYWYCQKIAPKRVQAAEGQVLKDQAEFLSFEQLKFINRVDEVPTTPALVAATATELLPKFPIHLLYQSPSWQIWQQ